MLGYWTFNNDKPKNYGATGYGTLLDKIGNFLVGQPIDLPSGFYYSFEAKEISGKILEHGDLSFGLIGLKNGVLPYVKAGQNFYKPDGKFAVDKETNWGIYYRREEFGGKDYTLSIYRNNEDIYTNGVDNISAYGNILFCNTGVNEVRLYNNRPIDPITLPNEFKLFGVSSGSIGSGFPLIIGASYSLGSGMNLTMGAVSGGVCYLLDESGGFILYDELSSDPLLPETCSEGAANGIFAGFDMYISGQAFTEFILPLYLQQSSTTYSLNSGFPLLLEGGGTQFASSIDLTVYNTYSSIGSGIMMSITATGINDGYIPISSGFPLYIQRNENLGFDLFISGASQAISGTTDLYLNANTYPLSGTMNLTIPYIKGFPNSGTFLYSAGY